MVGEGFMIWPRMLEYKVFVRIRVPKCVKITSAAYCHLLESVLILGLVDDPI